MDAERADNIKLFLVLAFLAIPVVFLSAQCLYPDYFPRSDEPQTIYDEYHHP